MYIHVSVYKEYIPKDNSLFNKANAKNINSIIVNGLSRKRTNKQRKKKKQMKRGGGLIEIVRSLSLSQASVMFFSIKCTFSH